MKKQLNILILILVCIALALPARAQDLVIVHTNDLHSQVEAFTEGRNAGSGGLLSLSGYLEETRKQYPNLLYLDAGDYNQGTPYYNLFEGMVEVEAMNALGLYATTLGNHEFDNGLEDLVQRLKKAEFYTLCANYNIRYRPLRKLIKPYVIYNTGSKKIGIIGLTIDLNGLTSGEVLQKMQYKDPVKTANLLANVLKKKGCHLIICLTHLGVQKDIDLAGLSRNIDLIIGGHSHTFLEEPLLEKNLDGQDVMIVQTGAKGVYTGRIDVHF